jgi:hypothetical protein
MKLFTISLILLLLNCTHTSNNIQQRIATKIEQSCGEKLECSIDMLHTTDFEWDTFYFFRSGLLSSEISEIIGRKVNFTEEFSNKYIFLRNGEVVYTEEHLQGSDGPTPGTVSIVTTDANNYFALIKGDSRLNARIDRRKGGNTYYLTCANCPL